ncbi:hypothetical protein [Aliidiomarina iranensis]|nr:hypothetical protein [Aliidiomarina iranensis]
MWSSQQRAAMRALGVPVYDFCLEDGVVEDGVVVGELCPQSATADAAPPDTSALEAGDTGAIESGVVVVELVHYRLGPWFLSFPSDIPAASFDWLRDLSSFIGGRPVQVSHIPDGAAQASASVVDCGAFAQNGLSPEQKRALWAKLKPALS